MSLKELTRSFRKYGKGTNKLINTDLCYTENIIKNKRTLITSCRNEKDAHVAANQLTAFRNTTLYICLH